MNKTNYTDTLRTLTDVSSFTEILNDAFHKNENGRYYRVYDYYVNSDYEYRDKQILFFADSVNHSGEREKNFRLRKKHGGFRHITSPKRRMRELLMSLNDILTSLYEPTPWAYGFVPKRSVVDNARLHVGKKFVLNIDLHDFFPSITFEQVKRCLMDEPYRFSEYAAELTANLCVVCRDGRKCLAQGFPTSPILSNMVCVEMDRRLAELAEQSGVVYSRYADDMTFSSNEPVLYAPDGDFFCHVKAIVENNGFTLNEKKTRFQRRGQQRQEVTGLNVTDKVNTTRGYMREIRSQLYIWERYGYAELCRAAYPHYKAKNGKTKAHRRHVNMAHVLRGKIDYLGMVRGKNDAFYQKCVSRLNELVAKNGKEIWRVEKKAYEDACEREDKYINRTFGYDRKAKYDGLRREEHVKTNMWMRVLKFIVYAVVYIIAMGILGLITK